MSLTNPFRGASSTPTHVARARRPLGRAYALLMLFFVVALAAIVCVGVIQASPSSSQYSLGWYQGSDRTGTAIQQQANDSPVQSSDGPDQIGFERRLFALVNQVRVERGLAPLKASEALTRAARAHAADMSTTQRLDAVDARGKSPLQRAEDAGFNPAQFVVEANGAGYTDADRAMSAFLANPNTLATLLNPDANQVGVGYAFARDDRAYRHYWTIDLGRLSGLSFTIVVNNGADSTESSQVTLHIGGKGWATEMQISNSPDFMGAAWQPFNETKTWELSAGTGPKTIYVKLRGPGNQEIVVVGTIALNAAAKGVKPGAPYSDGFVAPRPPSLRAPMGDIAVNGEAAFGAPSVPAFAANNSLTPGYYQTSEFMFGKVAVGLVTPQCNGAVDKCSETWTTAMLDQVTNQVTTGLNWWTNKLGGRVSFVVDQQRQVATGYEPINHAQSDENLWIGDTMTHLGFTGSTYFEQVYAYNNWMRQKYNTDWAFTIFVANSLANGPGTFSNGYFAYSYVPGPFSVITYDNDGYSINNMGAVVAHETGHVFGALDQYAGANVACSATSGYLVLQNQNSQQNCSSNVDSIMRGGLVPYVNKLVDPYALGMVGYRVKNPESLPDPINTIPVVALNAVPVTVTRPSLTISGTAQDQPFASPNGAAITINYITAVKYRMDNGAWQNASPADGSPEFNRVSENFVFTLDLTAGSHTVQVQATNRQNNLSGIVSATVTLPGSNATATPVPSQPTATPVPPTPTPTPQATPSATPRTSLAGVLVIPINAGNTAISLPYSTFTASALIKAINAQGGAATEVDDWTGREWRAYTPGGNGKDFEIQMGVGYIVKSQAASTWTVSATAGSRAQPIRLNKDWNMLGIPACRDGETSCYTASSIVAAINAQGGSVVEIDRMVNGAWSAYQLGYDFNDFPIYVGQAYFVRTTKASNWSP